MSAPAFILHLCRVPKPADESFMRYVRELAQRLAREDHIATRYIPSSDLKNSSGDSSLNLELFQHNKEE